MSDDALIRTLLALIRLHEREGRATVRGLCRERGLKSPGQVHKHLQVLRDWGFVTWDDGMHGTLRPTVRRVAGSFPARSLDQMREIAAGWFA